MGKAREVAVSPQPWRFTYRRGEKPCLDAFPFMFREKQPNSMRRAGQKRARRRRARSAPRLDILATCLEPCGVPPGQRERRNSLPLPHSNPYIRKFNKLKYGAKAVVNFARQYQSMGARLPRPIMARILQNSKKPCPTVR